jgi:predicted amidohydrolase YtcJ
MRFVSLRRPNFLMQPDAVLLGGTIRTIDPTCPRATALAIAGDRILAVGDDATVAALAGTATRRIELGRRHAGV